MVPVVQEAIDLSRTTTRVAKLRRECASYAQELLPSTRLVE